MKLEEMLNIEEEEEFEEDNDTEVDLYESLDLLQQCLDMLNAIKVKGGKVVKTPKGMPILMEELLEWLNNFSGYGDESEDFEKEKNEILKEWDRDVAALRRNVSS